MADNKNDWELFSWVIRGNQRRKVILALEKPTIPSKIKKEAKMSLSNVSKILSTFKKRGLVHCLNPGAITGRIYELTEKGQWVRDKVLEK